MKYLRKCLKIFLVFIVSLILLFLLAYVLVQQPKVQTWLVQQVTNRLSKTLDTRVEVQHVNIEFFKTAVLEDILIEDRHQDTLLYAKKLKANIGLFSLFEQRIHLNDLHLSNAYVNLHQLKPDTTFNYEFLIDAFTPAEPDTTTTSPWYFSIETVHVEETRFSMRDEVGGTDISANISDLNIEVDELDLIAQKIDIQKIILRDSDVAFMILESPSPISPNSESDLDNKKELAKNINIEKAIPLSFPQIPWEVIVDAFELKNNNFTYDDVNHEPIINKLDANHLHFSQIHTELVDFIWLEKTMKANLHQLQFQEKSGFVLEAFQVDLSVDTAHIQVQNLHFQTPKSNIQNNTQLTFQQFNDLTDFTNKVQFESIFENTEIAFSDIQNLIPNGEVIPYLKQDLQEKISLHGAISGKVNNLEIKDLNIKIGNQIAFDGDGTLQNIATPNDLKFNFNLRELVTSYQKIQQITTGLPLPQGLQNFKQVQLKAKARGRLDQFRFDDLELTTGATTAFFGNGRIKGVSDINNLFLSLNIAELKTSAEDLEGFVENGLPPQLDSLGTLRYSGRFDGYFHDFVLTGSLTTALGNLQSDVGMTFNEDFSSANYGGALVLKNFNLGRFLDQEPEIGIVSLSAQGTGGGFVIDSLQADAKVMIEQFEFKSYNYKDILIEGTFDRRNFNGNIELNDPNAKLLLVGDVDFNLELPLFQCVLNVDTLNLKNLHLSEKNLGFHARTFVHLQGNNIHNLDGKLTLLDLRMSNDSLDFQSDTITLIANQKKEEKRNLSLEADFLSAKIAGNYHLLDLSKTMGEFLDDYFPMEWVLDSIPEPDTIAPISTALHSHQAFDFEINLSDPTPITIAVLPQLTELEKASFEGHFDSKKRQIDLNGKVLNLTFGAFNTEKIQLISDSKEQNLATNIEMNQVNYGSSIFYPKVTLVSLFGNDSLQFDLSVESDTGYQQLNFAGAFTKPKDLYRLQFNPHFVLNNDSWQIDAKNELLLKSNWLFIKDLKLNRNQQQLRVRSLGNIQNTDFAPLEIGFNHFKISEIFEMLAIEDAIVKGDINGTIQLKDITSNLYYNADLEIDSLSLNQDPIGGVSIRAAQAANQEEIKLALKLEGPKNELHSLGSYAIQSREFDVKTTIQQLEMRLLDPFLEGMLEESSGNLAGQFILKGTPDEPDVNGEIQLQNLSTNVVLSNSRYMIRDHTIQINNREIKLGNLSLQDEKNQTATVKGRILHRYFSDWRYDLTLSTDAFQFLNTTALDNSLFYGQLFLEADVALSGSVERPFAEVTARTLAPSIFHLSPFSEADAISQDDYIIFANPKTYHEENTERRAYQIRNSFPFDVRLNLELSDAAELQFIIDPETGDKLVCRGNSNLLITMKPSGEMGMFGTYTIASGGYSFSYGQFIKRQFDIQRGGTVIFNGDPLEARFNVTAAYVTRTTTYELIKNESTLNAQEISDAQRRTEVEARLNLRGNLASPEISFDIQMPENQESSINSAVTRKLAAMRSNEDELNKQVFGLLLVNSFITAESSTGVLAGAGETAVLSSVSTLFSNQLNRLADRYLKGFEVNVDIDSYRSLYGLEGASTTTEVGASISKQLFNERLKVTAGGNVDLNSTAGESGFTSIAGDFLLEYRLTESGNYLLRAFRRTKADPLNETNSAKNGISIFVKKGFDGKK